jgi:hypothetical protein
VGVNVGVCVNVGQGVMVEVGVIVGPNSCLVPQLDKITLIRQTKVIVKH